MLNNNKFLVFIEFHDGRLFKYESEHLRLNEVWGAHDRLMDEATLAGHEEFKAWDSEAEVKSFKVYPIHDVVGL